MVGIEEVRGAEALGGGDLEIESLANSRGFQVTTDVAFFISNDFGVS
jgi:hypothetical protein